MVKLDARCLVFHWWVYYS